MMLISSGLGAAILSIFSIQSNSYGLAVLPSYLMYIYDANQLLIYFVVSLLSMGCCFILTCLFAIPQEILKADEEIAIEISNNQKLEAIISPASGKIIDLSNVNDEMFSSKTLGDGFAIELSEGKIVAPFNGKIITAFPTGHAFGILDDLGREVLIHIGIDTVELNGDGFDVKVKQGDSVKQGDVLVEIDLLKLKEANKDNTTMVIFTSGEKVTLNKPNSEVLLGTEIQFN